MAKRKKDKPRKGNTGPSAHNDQLGENASEILSDAYDNKKRNKK
jgi:hypothetical protein